MVVREGVVSIREELLEKCDYEPGCGVSSGKFLGLLILLKITTDYSILRTFVLYLKKFYL